MANRYCNPDLTSDGTGSEASPYNTWAGKTFSAGDNCFTRAGTRHIGGVTVSAAGTATAPIVFDKYGDGPLPILDGSNGSRWAFKAAGTGAHYIHLKNHELTGSNHSSNANFGIFWGDGANFPANNGLIEGCVVHDVQGEHATFDCDLIFVSGHDIVIRDCEVYNGPDDGIYVQGKRPVIEFCDISNIGLDSSSSGDCIQLTGGSALGSVDSYRVYGCTLKHSIAEKQAFIVGGSSSGVAGGLFRNNIVVMKYNESGYSGVYTDQPRDRIIGNRIIGGDWAIALWGSDQFVSGNIVTGAHRGCTAPSSGETPTIVFNTFADNTDRGAYIDTTAAVVHSNIFLRNSVGFTRKSGATSSNNAYFGNTTDRSWSGSAGTDESDAITDDPLIDSSFALKSGSPLRGVGLYLATARDYNFRKLRNPPDIGARQYYAPRSAVATPRT